jgi:hypothetical protein
MDETLFLNDTREYSSKSHNFMQKLHHGFSLKCKLYILDIKTS